MTILTSKFDVLRGWTPGGDAGIDQSIPPRAILGVPVSLPAGLIVVLRSDSTVDVPAALDANWKPYYVVASGNNDLDAQYVGKVVCLRGKLTIRTDKLAAAQTFPVAGPVAVDTAGMLVDAGVNYRVGFVLANNVSTNGTIDVELDI